MKLLVPLLVVGGAVTHVMGLSKEMLEELNSIDRPKAAAHPRAEHRARHLLHFQQYLSENGVEIKHNYNQRRATAIEVNHDENPIVTINGCRLECRRTRAKDRLSHEWLLGCMNDCFLPMGDPTAAPVTTPIAQPTPVADPTGAPVEAATAGPSLAPVAIPVDASIFIRIRQPSFGFTTPPVPNTASPTSGPTAVPVDAGSPVEDLIRSVALFGGSEFDDPASYQSCALDWLTSSDTAAFSDDKLVQRYSLASIFCATSNVSTVFTDAAFGGNIFPWARRDGWLTDADECTWANIQCNADGFVTILDLFSNLVTGTFPPEVQYLGATLLILDLAQNAVTSEGEIFNLALGKLTAMRQLLYEQTNFVSSTGIPTELGNLKRLEFYDCSVTRYAGALSAASFPSDMTQLTYLNMEFNRFNSSIPAEVGNLPALEFFYARDSFIHDDLEFMRNMQSIRECWVDTNPGLAGTLPAFLGSVATLESLSVTQVGFFGTLPSELGMLGAMQQMYLYENQFTGTVPEEWGRWSSITRLQMENNMLTGLIPPIICTLTLASLETLSADCVICTPDLGFPCCSSCV